ncbi:MAG: MarR family transcriptional regulator, partial [Halobacteriota archaeon]
LDVAANGGTDRESVSELAAEFNRLQSLESELSLAQRWVHGRLTDTLEQLTDRLGTDTDSEFYAEVLAAIVDTDGRTRSIADRINAPPDVVENAIDRLSDGGLVTHNDEGWTLR